MQLLPTPSASYLLDGPGKDVPDHCVGRLEPQSPTSLLRVGRREKRHGGPPEIVAFGRSSVAKIPVSEGFKGHIFINGELSTAMFDYRILYNCCLPANVLSHTWRWLHAKMVFANTSEAFTRRRVF